jgi:hypothetical protein
LNGIPEEEYQRLSNGKYSCAVCAQIGRTPVFDTPQMLQVHRQSKKHQEVLDEIEELKQKKKDRIAKEKDRAAAFQEAMHIQASNHARHIATQHANQTAAGIGVAAPVHVDVGAVDPSLDALSSNPKKRKEPTGDDTVAPLGSFSGHNHQSLSQQQQYADFIICDLFYNLGHLSVFSTILEAVLIGFCLRC